jgi:Mg-chelatase subunit ChlD
LAALGCGGSSSQRSGAPKQGETRAGGGYQVDLFKAEPREGTAVVILVDTSGSMAQPVKDHDGKMRPKHLIARDALERIIQRTAEWKKTHSKANLQLGIYNFSSTVTEILPIGEFDEMRARGTLFRMPAPTGGTAIGKALESGYKALYRSGCIRKFVVCITDGENTAGPPPDWIARNLHAQTKGEVELDFVAFDTSARQFQFLKEVNGRVVEASDGEQLARALTQIYEQRILVEKEEP